MTPAWLLSGFGDEIDADPEVQVAVLQALGAGAIEIRSAWDVNVVDLGADRLHELGQVLKRRGQSVSAIASPIGKVEVGLPIDHEVDRLDRAIEAAQLLGTRFVRVFSFYRPPDRSPESVRDAVLARMSALADRARREDVVLLHENEKEIYGDVPERVLDLVESVGSEHLRLAWDSANFVQCGVRPHTDGWPLLHRYVDYVQVKDALIDSGRVVPAGQGDGELPATLTALRDTRYAGYLSLEPHLGEARAVRRVLRPGPRSAGRRRLCLPSSIRSEAPSDDQTHPARRRRRRHHRKTPRQGRHRPRRVRGGRVRRLRPHGECRRGRARHRSRPAAAGGGVDHRPRPPIRPRSICSPSALPPACMSISPNRPWRWARTW